MIFQAARWRLVAWNVTVFSVILLLLGLAVYVFYAERVYDGTDQQLAAQRDQIESRLVQSRGNLAALYFVYPSPLYNRAYRTVIANSDGQINGSTDCPNPMPIGTACPPDSMKPTSRTGLKHVILAVGHGSLQDIRTDSSLGEPERVLTFAYVDPTSNSVSAVIQISRLAVGEESSLHELRSLLVLGGLLGIALAGLGSFFLANRALVPIRQAFGRQREFTADASHELRTPLTLIRANAEMLHRHADRMPPADTELVTEIIRETDHLNKLVGDLLTLARADNEQRQITKRSVDLRALVTEVHEDVQRIAEDRGITSQLSVDGPVVVQGDETRLRQLLLILLDNALKYTDAGGRVEVALHRDDNRAHLLVSDTGIGIPAKDLPRVFDRFYRVDRAREHASGGTGLGLAIARWIVQAHSGYIKVDSQSGRGTRFLVEVPVGKA